MLGYTHKNNDLFVFFENDELSRLNKEIIRGFHINATEEISKLEAAVDNELCKMELIATTTQKETISISIMRRVYDSLIERGKYELHEGYRHINLQDANRLDFSQEMLYEELKTLSKPKL